AYRHTTLQPLLNQLHSRRLRFVASNHPLAAVCIPLRPELTAQRALLFRLRLHFFASRPKLPAIPDKHAHAFGGRAEGQPGPPPLALLPDHLRSCALPVSHFARPLPAYSILRQRCVPSHSLRPVSPLFRPAASLAFDLRQRIRDATTRAILRGRLHTAAPSPPDAADYLPGDLFRKLCRRFGKDLTARIPI